jgi:acyl carrier protein
MWEGIGISREIRMKDLAHARGYAAITARQGLLSLLAGLLRGRSDLLIGLERRPQIRRLLTTGEHRVQQLLGYFSSASGQSLSDQLTQLVVTDRLQTPTRCTFIQLSALPRLADGQIDRQALPVPRGSRPVRESSYDAPQSDLERTIAAIWQDVLRVEKVGLNDNFFELGGQSLLMAQVQGKLRQKLNRDLSMVEMFRYPTVGSLAKHLGAVPPVAAAPSREQDRSQKQRAAISRQKQLAKKRRDGDE